MNEDVKAIIQEVLDKRTKARAIINELEVE